MRPEKAAIIPGILLSSVFIFMLSQWLFSPDLVLGAPARSTTAITEQNDTQPSEIEGCTLPVSFPANILQWCDWIEQYSQEYGVQANLVAAVMLQESGGDPKAYSRSGAVGLMQIMPSDGIAANFQCVNGPCFASRPGMTELFDPQFNIEYGVRMLSGLISRKGDLREALRAYGPYNVEYTYADKVLAIAENYQ